MGESARSLEREIALTRERLGETIDALAYKLDVKARVRENVESRVEDVKTTIADRISSTVATVGALASEARERIESATDLEDPASPLSTGVAAVAGAAAEVQVRAAQTASQAIDAATDAAVSAREAVKKVTDH